MTAPKCIATIVLAAILCAASSAEAQRDRAPERHGYVSARIVVGGWGIARNYLGQDGYIDLGFGLDAVHEVVLGRNRDGGRVAAFDIGFDLRGVYGNPGPVFAGRGGVELGLRHAFFGMGAFATVEGFIFNVPGSQRTWAGATFGPQIYLRWLGEPQAFAGAFIVRWAPEAPPVSLCGMENVEGEAFFLSGFWSFGAMGRWCSRFGPFADSVEASVHIRFVFY